MKKLSFIIPLYNSAKWLEKCLYSVLNQDIPESEMEIICVNDGSPDNSSEMAREIGKKHPSIIVIDQPNQGPSGARNTGMKAATGKYLCFVDPDDFVELNVYGKLLNQMEDEQLDMLRFNHQNVNEDYQSIDKPSFEQRFDYTPKLMSGAEFIATRLDIACNIWRYMYRREIITKNEIWCFTGDYYDDTPWLPLVLLKAERMNVCNTVVYNYLERGDSLVKTQNPKMLKRKSDGVILLLKYLEQEITDIQSGNLPVVEEWREMVIGWYRMVEAHAVVGLLTNIGTSLFASRKEYVRKLHALNLFPLSMQKAELKAKRKIRLANFHPLILVWFIRLLRIIINDYYICKKKLRPIKRVVKYLLAQKKYYKSIQLCDDFCLYLAQMINRYIPEQERYNKSIACISTYGYPEVFRINRSKYKFFLAQENTHVQESKWHEWENCYLWKDAPILSVGFDYINHPGYIRFPYWLHHIFTPEVTNEQVKSFVTHFNYADITHRMKDCAFICRNDYFGDRAKLADFVSQIMPISYPSDFRHNDDDMRGKFNDNKIAYLHQFKFNLCPENTNDKGYVTEKIFEAIQAGCVPIYWGNEGYPEPDILNPSAIIYIDKDNPAEGLTLLRKLYDDPIAYEEFASQPRFFPDAGERIYEYYERLERKIKEVLSK